MRAARWWFWLGIGALVFVVIAGIWLTYTTFTSRFPGGNDFLPRWVGGRAFIIDGISPYSEEAALRAQVMLHGRPAEGPEEDLQYFTYPLYSLLFVWPLCLVGDFALAHAIWMWVLLGALVASAVVWMRVIRWRPRLWMWSLAMAWMISLYHSFRAVLLGQYAVLVMAMLVAALWALQQGRDGWAGALLALATVKPPLVYLAIPWLLLWTAGKRRWRFWWGFGFALAGLVLGSMILLPTWPLGMVRQMLAYPSFTVYGSLTFLVVRYALGLGSVVEIVVTGLLGVGVIVLAWRLWRGSWDQMMWMLGLLLVLTNFFTPRIATTNYLMAVPWVLWCFGYMVRVWGRRGVWAVVGLEMVSLVGLWGVFLATIEGNFETAPVYFPFPLFVLALLGWLWHRLRGRDDVAV
jgi:hypothetical protein